MKAPIQVTFNKDGNHISKQMWISEQVTLKDNYMFNDTLTYDGWFAGRASAVITWKGSNGVTYQSGMRMLDEILSGKSIEKLSGWGFLGHTLMIKGNFTFRKIGTVVLLTISS